MLFLGPDYDNTQENNITKALERGKIEFKNPEHLPKYLWSNVNKMYLKK